MLKNEFSSCFVAINVQRYVKNLLSIHFSECLRSNFSLPVAPLDSLCYVSNDRVQFFSGSFQVGYDCPHLFVVILTS